MATRLDRIFILLETGSNPGTRRAAAKQLGEVQKSQPGELYKLLNRLHKYLSHSSWDTRMAGVQAIENVLRNVPLWQPSYSSCVKQESGETADTSLVHSNHSADASLVNSNNTVDSSLVSSNNVSDRSLVDGNNTVDSSPVCSGSSTAADPAKQLLCKGNGKLTFDTLDIGKVLHHGESLLACEGQEFDREDKGGGEVGGTHRLDWERKQLNKKLGLEGAASLGFDSSTLFSNDDLKIEEEACEGDQDKSKKKFSALVEESQSCLSSRERNRLKRKARLDAKSRAGSLGNANTASSLAASASKAASFPASSPSLAASSKRLKTEDTGSEETALNLKTAIKTETVIGGELAEVAGGGEGDEAGEGPGLDSVPPLGPSGWEDCVDWPFNHYCQHLLNDMFAAKWEKRHGIVTALRELIKVHGATGGMNSGLTQSENEAGHRGWLVDTALRLLCVLALDKFGDFVSDQVVAPVRESAAQALGAVFQLLDPASIDRCSQILLHLAGYSEWQVRHGGLLGLKYLLAVRSDCAATLLTEVYPKISDGLSDECDDVVGVAASALLPVVPHLFQLLPNVVPELLDTLWKSLLDLDDLTSSTHSIMQLLAEMLSSPGGLHTAVSSAGRQLTELVPRLFPFLSHSSSKVRMASLQTLRVLAAASVTPSPSTATPTTTPPVAGCDVVAGPPVWLAPCAEGLLRRIYQRSLLEASKPCLALLPVLWNTVCDVTPLEPLLMASCPWFGPWITLISAPAHAPLDPSILVPSWEGETPIAQYLGGPEVQHVVDVEERSRCVARARNLAAKLLGKLASYIVRPVPGIQYTPGMESPLEMLLSKVLVPQLGTRSAYQKLAIAIIIIQWREQAAAPADGEEFHLTRLPAALLSNLEGSYGDFSELQLSRSRLLSDAQDFASSLKHFKVPVQDLLPDNAGKPPSSLTEVGLLVGPAIDELLFRLKLRPKTTETIQERRHSLKTSYQNFLVEEGSLQLITRAMLAGALAHLGPQALPEKLNPVIKPLMECIKMESNLELQQIAAKSLVRVIDSCLSRETSPVDKVVKNLCSFVCCHPEVTPLLDLSHFPTNTNSIKGGGLPTLDQYEGILSLYLKERKAEKLSSTKSKTRTNKKQNGVDKLQLDQPHQQQNQQQQQQQQQQMPKSAVDINNEAELLKLEIQARGAEQVLQELVRCYGADSWSTVPRLRELSLQPLTSPLQEVSGLLEVAHGLRVTTVLLPVMPPSLNQTLIEVLPFVLRYVTNFSTVVRFLACGCLAEMSNNIQSEVVSSVVEYLLPQLNDIHSLAARQGSIEAVASLVDVLGLAVVPYIVLLVVPVLGAMSDPDTQVRLTATNTFASMVRLMPLDGGIPEPVNMPESLRQRKESEKDFLSQLLSSKSSPSSPSTSSLNLNVPIAADLRSYQIAGVNWLGFLNRYKLHGILCDDMGLGKTLQTICILASHHARLAREGVQGVQSLVICPTTLGGHWDDEVTKFVSNPGGSPPLSPLLYQGPPGVRGGLRARLPAHNLIITSYEVVRSEAEFFASCRWSYLVLDEGHIIRNNKSKIYQAVKQLVSSHRLILSGTPIQNNVTELWSLFDFLMPGYLGTEKQFHQRYAKPILGSAKGSGSSPQPQEAGVLAMEALHRQTLPFILRRMKEDVLSDLPPKITQDYYCDLSPLQEELYEDFTRSQAAAKARDFNGLEEEEKEGVDSSGGKSAKATTHIFQALQYLKKVCNHPRLVLSGDHPAYPGILERHLGGNSSNLLLDICHAAKLTALKQLLTDLGLGRERSQQESVVSPHRALIFCQVKAMLDIVEKDLIKVHLPELTYLRLDGSVHALNRHQIVSRFNNDPSIDVLLLSTSVGGLGLNLTGADTVIFVEHDWNPMKDLQAMDRAHRIGQKRVVNVYRLITRNTIEEKIMSLQKFKLHTARTVISSENSNLQTMQTDKVLDLFSLGKSNEDPSPADRKKAEGSGRGLSAVVNSLAELWEEAEYTEEYDMTAYIANLKSSS